MSEAQRRQQRNASAGMCLHRKGEHAARRQHPSDIGEHRDKVVDVDEHIGRQHQIVFCGFGNVSGQKRGQIADDKPIVIAFRLGARISAAS